MSFLLEYISESVFWTTLLILHGLVAVALIGALTHQMMATLHPPHRGGAEDTFFVRFRSVSGPRYSNAVCLLWLITFVLGGWIYAQYRISVRIPMEQQGFFLTLGAFEIKEHLAVVGLGLLPFYWYIWKHATDPSLEQPRKWVTAFLCVSCWYVFLAGHVVNNVRGYGS